MLVLVREAREHIECCRVTDAAWLLDAAEDDLVALHIQTQVAICLWNGIRRA
jgi:hypothetical protein